MSSEYIDPLQQYLPNGVRIVARQREVMDLGKTHAIGVILLNSEGFEISHATKGRDAEGALKKWLLERAEHAYRSRGKAWP